MNKFGERLDILKNKRGLNGPELGGILNVSRNAISYWINGKRTPDLDMIIKIAKYFDVTVDYLIGATDDPDTCKLENDEIPTKLSEIGVDSIEVTPYIKQHGFTKEEIEQILKDIMPFAEKMKRD